MAVEPRPVEARVAAASLDRDFPAMRERLVGICRSFVGDDAEDVVHDAYLVARDRIAQLRDAELLDSWLTTIAVRMCFQRHRRRQRLQALLPRLSLAERREADLDLRSMVEDLPFRERTIVVLHYGHGLPLTEIGHLLDTKPATVRSILFRVRRDLKSRLSDEATTSHLGGER